MTHSISHKGWSVCLLLCCEAGKHVQSQKRISQPLYIQLPSAFFSPYTNHRLARADVSLGVCFPVNASTHSIVAANDSKLPTQKLSSLIIQ